MNGSPPLRRANDPAQYDDLASEWWVPGGPFGVLHWLNEARASLVPPPQRPGAVLVDLACGGGLLAPYVRAYDHIGVDLIESATRIASDHGVAAIRGDVARLPLSDRCADVVIAGEILEHVTDLDATVAEIARILTPGGVVVLDTINDSTLSRLIATTVAERLPGGPPRGIHDPALFISRGYLTEVFARHGLQLETWAIRPSLGDYVRYLRDPEHRVAIIRTRLPAVLYAGVARHRAG